MTPLWPKLTIFWSKSNEDAITEKEFSNQVTIKIQIKRQRRNSYDYQASIDNNWKNSIDASTLKEEHYIKSGVSIERSSNGGGCM